ncbi:type IV pilus modification protein PilV [Endozoicomonas sp. 4G]|uniref:type IV pilus modification protein PilV n=1 Tax=Endozoicomonas sp. 4G TaxID=2872754 RepID=UPI0020785F39|nr:type IV pilus modification protein PilV [Endozoicomonas sp. 4G]
MQGITRNLSRYERLKQCFFPHADRRQKGVGLIEVMVALLVISVGVLGMAGLQTKSLQHNQLAYLRSQAVIIVNDMMDRIRANKTIAASGNDYVITEAEYVAAGCTTTDFIDRCESATCNESQLAIYDVQQWKFQMACQLPDATGSIAIENTSSGRVYVITLKFNDSHSARAAREVVLRSAL